MINRMTYKEFTFWLGGFLSKKNGLTKEDIVLIMEMMERAVEEPKINKFPNSSEEYQPRRDITFPHPFNPTCKNSGDEIEIESQIGPGRFRNGN